MNIYKITNLTNDKVYIGQTKNTPEYRFKQHIRTAKSNKANNYGIFLDAILQDGEENFVVDLVEVVQNQTEADERERFWIRQYHSDDPDFGYNSDSGGISGGTKNSITKKKIGLTTLEKWNNPEIAQRMLDGLRKGTETTKANIIRVPFKCPICGKILNVEPYVLKTKKYCSMKCAIESGSWKAGVKSNAVIAHEKNIERKVAIKEDIIKWCLDNKEVVMNCPKNAISTNLVGLKDMLLDKYNIKDLRTIFICFEVKSRKSLLCELQNIIKSYENVRWTGLN